MGRPPLPFQHAAAASRTSPRGSTGQGPILTTVSSGGSSPVMSLRGRAPAALGAGPSCDQGLLVSSCDQGLLVSCGGSSPKSTGTGSTDAV
jgi:hypothetical protein